MFAEFLTMINLSVSLKYTYCLFLLKLEKIENNIFIFGIKNTIHLEFMVNNSVNDDNDNGILCCTVVDHV
jgi:hypothetical protein